MSEVTSSVNVGGQTSDGFEVFASLNDGFFGTGYSAAAELSFTVMALIVGYVVISMFKYFLPEFRLFGLVAGAMGSVAGVIGLRDR